MLPDCMDHVRTRASQSLRAPRSRSTLVKDAQRRTYFEYSPMHQTARPTLAPRPTPWSTVDGCVLAGDGPRVRRGSRKPSTCTGPTPDGSSQSPRAEPGNCMATVSWSWRTEQNSQPLRIRSASHTQEETRGSVGNGRRREREATSTVGRGRGSTDSQPAATASQCARAEPCPAAGASRRLLLGRPAGKEDDRCSVRVPLVCSASPSRRRADLLRHVTERCKHAPT